MQSEISRLRQQLQAGKITRREFLRYAGLLGLSLGSAQALLACAPQPTEAPTAKPTEAPAAAATKAPAATPVPEEVKEAVTLHWYNPHGAPVFAPHWEKLISEFEAANPDIKMSSDIVGWGDLNTKIAADIAAGTLPDLTTMGWQAMLGYYDQGVLVEVDPVIEQLKSDGVEFNPALLTATQVGDKHYNLPRYTVFHGFTYRRDWFEEAGIEVPDKPDKFQFTWDEFIDVCEKLNNPPDRYAFAAPWGTFDGAKGMWNFLLGNGIHLIQEDGKSLDWDIPKVKEVYEFVIEISEKYAPPGVATYALEDVNTAMSQERIAMAAGDGDVHLELNENPPDWIGDDPGSHVAFMGFPYGTVPKGGMYGAGAGFLQFDAGHIEETYRWFRFFFQNDNLIESFFPFRVLVSPATLTAQTSTKFTEDPAVIAWKPVLDQLAMIAKENPSSAVAAYYGPNNFSWEIEQSGILAGVVQKVLAGDASLDDALADAKRGLEEILEG